jgi:DNA-binding NarL/FixJ family response regulator
MDRGSKARILVVDDHAMIRQAIRIACSGRPGLEVVGEAATGPEALQQNLRLRPDVVVLDLILPVLDGLEVARQLKADPSGPRILVLTAADDEDVAFEALRLGVDGYVEKTAPLEEIAGAIEAVAGGTQVFSVRAERTAHARLGELARRARETARAVRAMTRRERQVLALIAQGLSTRQIASRLKVSERTVESHIGNLYQKLGVRTRVQALYRAAGLGLVDITQVAPPQAEPEDREQA